MVGRVRLFLFVESAKEIAHAERMLNGTGKIRAQRTLFPKFNVVIVLRVAQRNAFVASQILLYIYKVITVLSVNMFV